jgi:hypothetical protein
VDAPPVAPEAENYHHHAPMVVEALARHGLGATVHRWLDGYAAHTLAERHANQPDPGARVADPLGDPVRTGDWLDFFDRELAARPWREVLVTWWPRLPPRGHHDR